METTNYPSVWVLNADFMVLGRIEWQRAVTLLVTGAATPFKVHPTTMIRSASMTVPLPEYVILRNWVSSKRNKNLHEGMTVSKRDILRRDGYTCAYCGEEGNTVDHILPESRGGENTWGNLVCACRDCNGKKDNMTPEEAGMKLLWTPTARQVNFSSAQAEVWKILDEQYGAQVNEPVRV